MSHLSPRQIDVMIAIWELRQNEDIDLVTLDALQQHLASKGIVLTPDNIVRIISGTPNKDKIFAIYRVRNRKVYELNSKYVVTSPMTARMLIKLEKLSGRDHYPRAAFEKEILKSSFFKTHFAEKLAHIEPDPEAYLKRIIDWCIHPEVNCIIVPEGIPTHIRTSERVQHEMAFLLEIAMPEKSKPGSS